jgi:hypothetical protein
MKQIIERNCLRDRTRKSVEHKAVPCIGLCNPFDDRGQNKRIGDELAARHRFLDFLSDVGFGGSCRAQHVPG